MESKRKNITQFLIAVLIASGLFSCKKEKLEAGVYEFSVDSSTYLFDNFVYEVENISPKEIILVQKSEFLLEFDFQGKANYLSVDDENEIKGVWVFNDTVPGTNDLLGYDLEGKIEKKKRNWFIEGNIIYKKKHFDGSTSYMVDVTGKFLLSKKE